MGKIEDIALIIGQKLLIGFEGKDSLPLEVIQAIQRYKPGGVTLFRSLNIESPAQLRRLTHSLQEAARRAQLPLLFIGLDQEGGQLMAVGDGTPFPGNMALGATGSSELARRTGFALGRELAAMGVNVNYAPVCDVNINPKNPVIGIRSFGEDPHKVADLCASMIEGIQAAGVAATAKHFPGHGNTAMDSHYGTPQLMHDEVQLRQVELPPFKAAVQAGVRLVMTAHIATPNLHQGMGLPATLSPWILNKILRQDLGFKGVILSDAMDMKAIEQGEGLGIDAIAAVKAGVDLLLLGHNGEAQARVYSALTQALRRGLLSQEEIHASVMRIEKLKQWIAKQNQPPIEVVGCRGHHELANEIASRSVTLVRDQANILPVRLASQSKIAVIVPRPEDLTPADTSSQVRIELAEALRGYHPHVVQFDIPIEPSTSEIDGLLGQLQEYELIVVGTINAIEHTGQATLVNLLLETGRLTVVVGLRLPYDLQAFPKAPTYLCTYSILKPAIDALSAGLMGKISLRGKLPVTLRIN